MTRRLMIALAAGLAFVSPASAQKTGPNGGTVVMAEDHPVEFVANGADLVFFLEEESGKPMATAGLTARAVIQDGGKTQTVPLAPAGPNKFTGTLPAPLGKGARIVFTTRAHGHALQARFEHR